MKSEEIKEALTSLVPTVLKIISQNAVGFYIFLKGMDILHFISRKTDTQAHARKHTYTHRCCIWNLSFCFCISLDKGTSTIHGLLINLCIHTSM